MRTVTGGETTLLQGAHFATHARVLVEDADGTYQDLTNQDSIDWVHSGSIAQTIDQIVATGTFAFWRKQEGGNSLSPLDEDSLLNRDAMDAYAPLIQVGRGIRCEFATVAIGSSPSGGDWKRVYQGVIDQWTVEDDFVNVLSRDSIGAEIADRWAEQERELGTVAGRAMEDVIQDILTEWTSLTLYTPTSPSFLITTYTQQRSTVMEAIQQLAALIGWVVQPRWDDGTSSFRLTLYDPVRAPGGTDWTWAADRYEAVPDFTLSRLDIRNALSLWYTHTSGVRLQVTAEDGTSIADYDRQFMEIEEPEDSPIDTAGEAQDLLDNALLDLKDPIANQQIKTLCFWPIQLNDYYAFVANDVHYSANVSFGVTGFRHEFSGGQIDTFIDTRGVPAGFVKLWIERGSRPVFVEDVELLHAYLTSIPFTDEAPSTGITATIKPDFDLDNTDWLEGTDAPPPIFDQINVVDDAKYAECIDSTKTNCAGPGDFRDFEIRLQDPPAPADSQNQELTIRLRANVITAGGGGGGFIVQLKQGSTVISTLTIADALGAIANFSKKISNTEYDAITDHNDLRIRVEAELCGDLLEATVARAYEVDAAYTAKTPPPKTGRKIDLNYDVDPAVDELDIAVTWNDGTGPTTHSYTQAGISGQAGVERIEGPTGDFHYRDTWTGFSLDVTPVAQPGDVSGRLLQLGLETGAETGAGTAMKTTAGPVVTADFAVAGTNVEITTDNDGRPQINAVIGASGLDGLTDVTLTAPATNEVLVKSAGDWINRTLAEAGISAVGHTHVQANITDWPLTTARGGTGLASPATGRLLVTAGASAMTLLDEGAAGGIVVSSGTAWVRAASATITSAGAAAFASLTLTTDLAVAHGGTGRSSVTSGYLLRGNGSGAMLVLAPGSAGNFVRSDGAAWAQSTIAAGDIATGTLGVARGGTGLSNPAGGRLLVTQGTGAFTLLDEGVAGGIIVSSGTAWIRAASATITTAGAAAFTSGSISGKLRIFGGVDAASLVLDRNGSLVDRFRLFVGDGTAGTVSDENYISSLNTNLRIWGGGSGDTLVALFSATYMQAAQTGTAAAPSLIGPAVTDRGFYFPNTTSIGLTSGGIERFFLQSTAATTGWIEFRNCAVGNQLEAISTNSALDFHKSNVFSIDNTGSKTVTFSNEKVGFTYLIIINPGANAENSWDWPTGEIAWANDDPPTLSTDATLFDQIHLTCIATNAFLGSHSLGHKT